jgi:hypothetical protein
MTHSLVSWRTGPISPGTGWNGQTCISCCRPLRKSSARARGTNAKPSLATV